MSARGQQRNSARRIGYFSAASAAANAPRLAAFRQGMTELGWAHGKDYVLDARYAEGASANISRLAADAVASRPDIILVPGDEAIRALAKTTTTIPIVFATADDPVRLGVAKSLQRPGGNLTGLVTLRNPLGAKRLELFKQTFSSIRHVAVLFPVGDVASKPQIDDIESAAARLGLQVSRVGIENAGDIAAAVKRGAATGCQGFVVTDGFLINTQLRTVIDAIAASKLPAIFGRVEHVAAGALMAYSGSNLDNFRRSASYVDKILKGAKPGELAIEQPSKFDFAVNLKTAKAIGVTLPTSVLARADRVIQ
jgi:putative tryptophan/tyrosine transport system substrate-binding protein